jgi:hypothetical protein
VEYTGYKQLAETPRTIQCNGGRDGEFPHLSFVGDKGSTTRDGRNEEATRAPARQKESWDNFYPFALYYSIILCGIFDSKRIVTLRSS